MRAWIGVVLLSTALGCAPRAPDAAAAPAPTAAREGLAGSASCRTCHERFYRLWSTSFHGLAVQPRSGGRTSSTS